MRWVLGWFALTWVFLGIELYVVTWRAWGPPSDRFWGCVGALAIIILYAPFWAIVYHVQWKEIKDRENS